MPETTNMTTAELRAALADLRPLAPTLAVACDYFEANLHRIEGLDGRTERPGDMWIGRIVIEPQPVLVLWRTVHGELGARLTPDLNERVPACYRAFSDWADAGVCVVGSTASEPTASATILLRSPSAAARSRGMNASTRSTM